MKSKHLCHALVVAFVASLASCGTTTYMVTSGSENLRSLTKITEGKNSCSFPSGSVESETLFFTMAVDYEKGVYKKDNPLAPSQVQVTSGQTCLYPTYCVANDRVAFTRWVDGYYDIYMMPATKGNALIPVTETNRDNELVPSFSPDGTLIAFQKGLINSRDAEIWLKNTKTGETMLLGQGSTPSISPDGKKIAYAKIESSNSRNIWVMDIDGSNAQQLTSSKEEFAGFPKWSPTGDKIVFQSNKNKGNFDIFVMNANGTGLVQLTTNESDDYTPFWSKEGFIYMSSDRGDKKGNFNIWRFHYTE